MKKLLFAVAVTLVAVSATACFPGPTHPAPLPAARR